MAKEKIEIEKQIVLMLGYLCINNIEITNLSQKVDVLDRFGLTDAEIAKICVTKEQGIRDARSRAKKKK